MRKLALSAGFVVVAALALVALPAMAGNGNGIPPGVNPFVYLLGLIENLQDQIDELAGGSGCVEVPDLVGTWDVENKATGDTGEVTFNADGTYTIDSGDYGGGGSTFGATDGAYEILPGGAIGITHNLWAGPEPFSRILVVQCASENEVIHFTLGASHEYEVLSRQP